MVECKIVNIQNLNVSVFRKKGNNYLYIYNTNYYSIIKANQNIKIINNTFICLGSSESTTPHKGGLGTFLKQFYICEYVKIKFSGKGYKIKKNSQQSLVLLFNRSHTTVIWWSNLVLRKLKKYKIYLKYDNKNRNIVHTMLNVRPVNVFTKKGLRLSRQVLFKKKGKK